MMKALLLILAILFISGCDEPTPCSPQPCVQNYPKLPTYKLPVPKGMTSPVSLGNGMYAIVGEELKDCLVVNKKLRKACINYAAVNSRVNKEYQR